PVFTGTRPFLHAPHQVKITNRLERAYDLVTGAGAIVVEGTLFTPATFTGVATLHAGRVLDLDDLAGFAYDLRAGDQVALTVYDGTRIFNLAPGDFTVDVAGNRLVLARTIATSGPVSVAVTIATPAVNAVGAPKRYFGDDSATSRSIIGRTGQLQVGDPVLDSQGNFVLDDAGEVARHTAETIGKNKAQEFLFLRGVGAQSFQLDQAPNGFVKVVLGERELAPSEYSFTGTGGRTLRVNPGSLPLTDTRVVVTYRLEVKLHTRGEVVYELNGDGEWVPVEYAAGTPRYYLGNEARLHRGGEAVMYASSDPVLQAVEQHRLRVEGEPAATQSFIFGGGYGTTISLTGTPVDGTLELAIDGTPLSADEFSLAGNTVTLLPLAMPAESAPVLATYRVQRTQTLKWGLGSTATVVLDRDPHSIVSVTVGGVTLTAAQIVANGGRLTLKPAGTPALGAAVVVTYQTAESETFTFGDNDFARFTLAGSPYAIHAVTLDGVVLGAGEFAVAGTTLTLTPALRPGASALVHVEYATRPSGMPGEILWFGVENVVFSTGAGDDTVTVVTTHANSTSIDTGAGEDRVAVRGVNGQTSISTQGGDDTIHVGSQAGLWENATTGVVEFLNDRGNLNAIDALLHLDAGAGTNDALWLDETGETANDTGTLDFDHGTGLGSVSGLGMGGLITFRNLDDRPAVPGDPHVDLDIRLGTGDDRFNVLDTHGTGLNAAVTHVDTGAGDDDVRIEQISGPTRIWTRAGDDTFHVGSAATDASPSAASTLDEIDNAWLELFGGASDATGLGDRLFAYDTADVSGDNGMLTATELTGLGMTNGIRFVELEALSVSLSRGSDDLFVRSTHTSPVTIFGNDGDDTITINLIAAPTTIEGGAGDDTILVNYERDSITFEKTQTDRNGIGAVLELDGEEGADTYDIGLAGTGSSIINVFDTGVAGIDDLFVRGTNDADFFLLRANRDATRPYGMVAAIEVDANRVPVPNGAIERVNYDGAIDGRFVIFGREGDDTFVLDDNLARTVIFGDAGADTFQVGQVFASPRDERNPNSGLHPNDYFETTATTRGYLSNGISSEATLFGGFGDDTFTVYHNRAELFLFGEEDDDTFRIRAFVRVNPNDPDAPYTNVNGGQGADFISFTVNAPVRIEGGDGFDTVTVIGTEFGDDFMVTAQGVFGSGLFVTYNGIEKVVVDALEGNDRFFIANTNENVALELVGGLGSDTFNLGGGNGGNAITVVSNSLSGHSGLVVHTVSSSDVDFNAIFAPDISTQVGDNDEPGAVVTTPNMLRVFEEQFDTGDPRLPLVLATYSIVLTRSPEETVRITASPSPVRESEARAGGEGIALAGPGGTPNEKGTTLLFDRTNWFIPQLVTVVALPDFLAEGRRYIAIQHTVIEGAKAGDGGAYDGLNLRGVMVEVIDDEVADVVVAETGEDTLVAEGSGAVPGQDSYWIVLTRAPALGSTVRISISSDAQLLLFEEDGVTPLAYVEFDGDGLDGDDWNDPRRVVVKAKDDPHKEGTHYSRIAHLLTGSIDDFLDITVANVAAGLGSAVLGNPSETYDAEFDQATGTLTISNDRAFSFIVGAPPGGSHSVVSSTRAYVGTTTVTLDSGVAVVAGMRWVLELNGVPVEYVAVAGDTLTEVAEGLSDGVLALGGYTTSASGFTLTVHRDDPYKNVIARFAPDAPTTALHTDSVSGTTFSTTHYVSLELAFASTSRLTKGDQWRLTLNDTVDPAEGVLFTFVVGSRFRSLDLGDAAAGLAAAVNADTSDAFTATADGRTLFISSATPFATTAVSWTTAFGTATIDLARSVESGAGLYTKLALLLAGEDLIEQGDSWTLTLAAKTFTWTAPAIVSATRPDSVDVALTDDDAPGVLVRQTGGGTSVIEPSTSVLLGSGSVTDVTFDVTNVIVVTPPASALDGWRIFTTNPNILIAATPTPAGFTKATLVLFGPFNPGSEWSVTIDDKTGAALKVATYVVPAGGASLATVAAGLAAAINAHFDPDPAAVHERTRFRGDFGAAVIRESGTHDSVFTAQDVDLAKWNQNANGDITRATELPHLSVIGTGDGTNDFYKFVVTAAMLTAAGSNGVEAVFDIDGGFEYTDAILWASQLRLHRGVFNAGGTLVGSTLLSQGPGFASPGVGGGGSTSWLDDYLTFTFTEAGTYFLEVGKWFPFGDGLPNGVDYELHLSLEAHRTDGFLFAPEAVLENEQGNDDDDVPGTILETQLLVASNFFTFFDSAVGNTELGGPIDFLTPYARIRGTGDGSFDVYSFEITNDMIDPTVVNVDVSGSGLDNVLDASTFFTVVDLVLTGDVAAGDVWTLGLRYRNHSYTAQLGDDLEDVARGLLAALPDRYKVTGNASSVSQDGSGRWHLTVKDANGFNLKGLTVDGIARDGLVHEVVRAGTITRTTDALNAAGTALISFSSARIALQGPLAEGDIWSVRVNGTPFSHTVGSAETLTTLASALAAAITVGGVTVTASGTGLDFSGSPVTLGVSIAGTAPRGSVVISGTPVPAQSGDVAFVEARVALPAARHGETWTVTLRNADGTGSPFVVAHTVGASENADAVADALAALLGPHGFTATGTGATLVVSRTAAFRVEIAVTPSGSRTIDPAPAPVSKTVTLNAAFQAGDVWTVELRDAATNALIGSRSASGTDLTVLASSLASLLSGISGIGSASEGAALTITRTAGGNFNVVLSVDPADSAVVGAATSRTVTLAPAPVAGDSYTLTVDGNAFTRSGVNAASLLAGDVDGLTGYQAVASGNTITIVKTAPGALAVDLVLAPAGTANVEASSVTVTLTGTPADTQVWSLSLSGGGSATYTVSGSGVATDTIAADWAADLAPNSAYLVSRSGSTLTITRLAGGGLTATFGGSATGTTAAAPIRVETFTLAGPVAAGDTWTLTLEST
ncbi:MAG TPA: hypothetical protein VF044_01015, partial [Actinomycetota bacterium]